MIKTWIIRYKEVGSDHYNKVTFSGSKTSDEVVDYLGLRNADVEDYEIREAKE